MNKNEFLKKLKIALENDLSQSQLKEKLDYYDNYISNEIKNGRREEDVINELGEPNLIAKTIKQVLPKNNNTKSYNESSYSENNDYYKNDNYESNTNRTSQNSYGNIFRTYNGSGLSCFIISLVVLLILISIFRLIEGLLYGSFYLIYNFPLFIIVVLLIIYLVYKKRGY